MNENQIIINTNQITEEKQKEISEDITSPIKLIKTNRAECQHMKDEGNFNLNDFIEEDFFNNEKAIKLRKEENIINEKERDKIFSNFMLVVKWLEKIPNKEEEKDKNKKEKNLYDFFYSEEFNIDSLMVHLNKHNKISIIDTLVDLMYKKYINQSFFYLPQLCMFFNYKEYYSSLESYLLDRCVDQIKFSLQITWLLNSFIEDDYSEIKLDIYESLLQRIEETLVNGERNTIKVFNQYDRMNLQNTDENNINNRINKIIFKERKNSNNSEMEPFLVKQCRLSYFDMCIDFYSSLKYMCEDLKNYDKENGDRKNKLKRCIEDFNLKLSEQRINNEEFLKNYPSFFGIILPFNDTSSIDDIDSNFIVRLIPEECFCFSTKARVPTKICAECITVKDLQNSELLNTKKKKYSSNTKIRRTNGLIDKNISGRLYPRSSLKRKTEITSNINNFSSNNISKEIKFDQILQRGSETIFSIKEEDVEQEDLQKEKLKQFLAETNKLETQKGKKDINKENKNDKFDINDFEILSDITEELKNVFGKPMNILQEEIKQNSSYKNFKSYKLINFIAKADDDLRQELLAMQLIKFFDKIFKKENIQLKLHPYEILITSSSSGLLEFLQNTCSIDGIKKKMVTDSKSLYLFYKKYFKENFEEAQINFTRSLAAYSLICYYLKIKDRHNGNILIDMYGNIIHIDFGFILGISPGGINFENAPFKLTKEYVEIMGGIDSLYYQMYKDLMIKGMIICKKYVDDIINIAEIMSKGSKMPCFFKKNIDEIFKSFRERFYADKKDEEFIKIVDDMIYASYDNFRTNQYDNFQKLTNGIIP